MEFEDVIQDRRSIRKYKNQEIDEKSLKDLISTVKYIPSAHNLQDYFVYVVKNKEKISEIAKACLNQKFITEAPVVFVFCADMSREGTPKAELYSTQSATMAAYAVSLKAEDLGLGSCFLAFDEMKIAETLDVEGNLVPIAIVVVGHPAEDPKIPKRKDDYFEIVK